ncbi:MULTISPECIES: hypothetical protein [unclassified Clostridioides]|uniref:hypothetical protein n=1 Tax=unclassified Clostridioides TaxID=2635829 RepID=UPI0006BBCF06|nr:hypothetical protein KW95_10960 [Clostridioides difficile]MCC0693233.1 hypothetical protein [Clostridioides sp. ZZV14-6387]KPI51891.1 hypothetical protein KW94_11265 [Clostridioides difficile]MCI9976351.1 hypothetical protein [Clostridioides difficile]MDB3085500.1 hypothetical protein [Clostridioides difficile]
MIIIRSQDKTDLMQVNQIKINDSRIYVVFENLNTKKIGTYESNARAIQVLDNIQSFIENGTKYDYITSNKVRYNINKIFQMPIK